MKTLQFKPTIKQFKAWEFLTDNITTELGFGGAASGGKSWLLCVWLLFMCVAYPKTRWLMGRRELKNLKRTTLTTFFKVLNYYKLEDSCNYNAQDSIVYFKNGSEILLVDLGHMPSDPLYTRLGGLELTGAGVDEANEVNAMAIEIIKTRIGRYNNDKFDITPKIFETFNPNKGHVYHRYYKPYIEKSLPEHRQFIQALPADNPHTPASYIEQLQRADTITKERLLYGNFEYDDDPAKLLDYNEILDLFTNTPKQSEEKYISCDVARFGKDKTVIMLWEGLAVKRIITIDKSSVVEVADKIKQLAEENSVRRSHVVIDEDGVGGGVCDILEGSFGFVNNSSPIEINNVRPNFANLKTQCAFEFSKLAKQGAISVSAGAETKDLIIQELEQLKQKNIDSDNKIALVSKDQVKENIGRSPDYSDCLIQRMVFELKQEKDFFIGGF
jgi:hypothetical protein